MIHRKLTDDSTSTRIAPTLSAAPTAATTAAQRIAVFHSTCRGLGGGIAIVLAAPAPRPPLPARLHRLVLQRRLSCGAPHCGQNGDSPLPLRQLPSAAMAELLHIYELPHPTPLRKQA